MMRSLITACGCSILYFFGSTCFIARLIADPPMPEVDALGDRSRTVLDPNKKYGRLLIQASNIKIDGRGALIEGQTRGDATANGNARQGIAGRGVKRNERWKRAMCDAGWWEPE
ncbi:MAG: hypothetical protein U0892_13715 [Pirellulales bacterium]